MRAGQEDDLATRRVEQIEAPTDIARAAAGELLEVVDGQHAVDEGAYSGPQAGGREQGQEGRAGDDEGVAGAERSAGGGLAHRVPGNDVTDRYGLDRRYTYR